MLLHCVAVIIATSCSSDVSDRDSEGPFQPIPPSNEDEQAIADLADAIQRDLDELRARPISDEQRTRLDAAEARVRRALRNLRVTRQRGVARGAMIARIGGVSAALLVDDTTVVGVADNGLLILCGIAAVVTILTTSAEASKQEIRSSWNELRDSLLELEDAIAAITSETCTSPIKVARDGEESEANTESKADGRTHTTAEPVTRAARRHGRNQKCSDDELTDLQGIVDSVCKRSGKNSCRKGSNKKLARMQCSEVMRRQAHHQACLSARRRVQKRCFRRTDQSHARPIRERKQAIAACKELAAQQCAPDSQYNDL